MAAKKEKPKLKVEERKIIGQKVKLLRREGVLPANIYGKKVKSQSVQLDLKTFLPVYEEAGETGVVNLQLKGETKVRPVLIHNVQLDPVTDQPLHADFYQVSLKEKVTTEIPIELVGESPAVKNKLGILIQPSTEVEVEALPTDLPDKFEVDIGKLEKVDDTVTVADLKIPQGVKILTEAKQILTKIEPPAEEEIAPVEKEVPSEAEAPAEEAVERAPAEGVKPPAGEKRPGKGEVPEGGEKTRESGDQRKSKG